MMPTEPPQAPSEAVPGPVPIRRSEYRWYHQSVVLMPFCLVIGIFLMIFPWTDYWEGNYFSSLGPQWRQYWDNMYVRGAVSGLGVLNLYISLAEVFRFRRYSKH